MKTTTADASHLNSYSWLKAHEQQQVSYVYDSEEPKRAHMAAATRTISELRPRARWSPQQKLVGPATAKRRRLKMIQRKESGGVKRFSRQLALILFMGIAFKSSLSDNNICSTVEAQIALTGGLLYSDPRATLTSSSSPSSPLSSSLTKRDLSVASQLELPATSTKVCQVNGGESVAIVEIEESRGSDISQSTNPVELPITGSVGRGEIELRIESETHKYFQIQDKKLKLVRPIDRDAVLKQNTTQLQIQQQPITSIYLQISCVDKRFSQDREFHSSSSSSSSSSNKLSSNNKHAKKVIIPVLVKVLDVNDNAPKFSAPIYTVQVDELAPIGTIVVDQIQAIDLDSANNGLIEYSLIDTGAGSAGSASRLVQRAQPYALTSPLMDTSSGSPAPATVSAPAQTTTTTTSTTTRPTTTLKPSVAAAATTTTTGLADGQASSEMSMSAASSTARSQQAAPTINLNSEPIVNGPMEDGDADESDEALLASMNSTDIETESDTMMLMLPSTARARRHAPAYLKQQNFFFGRRFVSAQEDALPAPDQLEADSGIKPKDLWTDLMSVSDDTAIPFVGSHQQTAPTQHSAAQQQQAAAAANFAPVAAPEVRDQQRASIEYFNLELTPHTNRPIIRLKRQLDYESKRTHVLTLLATDKASSKQQRLTSSTTIVVKVMDGDDQGPAFILEQNGCATSSMPPTTVSSLSGTGNSLEAPVVGVPQLQRRQLEFADEADASAAAADTLRIRSAPQPDNSNNEHHHTGLGPKNFKVTEENFDFSDVGGPLADSGPDSAGGHDAGDSELDELPAGSIVRLDPSLPLPAARARRDPPARGGAGSDTQQHKPTQLNDRPSAIYHHHHYHHRHHHHHQQRSDHHYYSCLSLSGAPTMNSGQAEYFATVMSGESDYLLRVAPQAIRARDRDELNAPIRYSFINGTPANYSLYFQINPLDASIKQVAPIERSLISRVVLWVQAQEQTANALSSVAKLTIDVVASDKNPPVLVPNSYAGVVDENSPIGASVCIAPSDFPIAESANRSTGNVPLRISIVDADQSSPDSMGGPADSSGSTIAAARTGNHLYEFETTSDAFKVNKDGIVYVNKWPLDRDAAGQAVHIFQVTARQIGLASSRSISSPISINITLLDLNDNPPIIANSSLVPVQLPANTNKSGATAARLIAAIKVTDADEPANARARFSIHHVSNGGRGRFRLHDESGQLEALGKFQAGEQFSLTLQARDDLGRVAQGILEVTVVPGPNSGGPQFLAAPEAGDEELGRSSSLLTGSSQATRSTSSASSYAVAVNEGIAPNSAIFQLQASDPENDPITYAILEGNINNDFYVNSKTGTIFVANKLDREEVSAYTLLVQARDSGGLQATRALHISVSDNNDQNPVFSAPKYTFSVEEGVSNRVLGRVWASDGDAGDNGRVSYYMEPAEAGAPFAIDKQSGEIKLDGPLDYEAAKSHTLLVTARDHGEEPRSATVSVLVRVIDVQDEAPYFERQHLEARLHENLPAGQRVAQVQARDPDSVAQITYTLIGASDYFAVDPQSGLVSTQRALDYETSEAHQILVATSESGLSADKRPDKLAAEIAQLEAAISSGNLNIKTLICRIDVSVLDTNDHAPQFVAPPLPIRVQDTTQLGSQVARLTAQDLDGSEPNNQVRYELVVLANSAAGGEQQRTVVAGHQYTSERCAQSFMVDATSGSVSIRTDLRRDSQSECQLVIRAKDLGQQPRSLSSTVQLIVYIDHLAEISSATMIGFADTVFTIELEEMPPVNTLVKVLPIVNKPKVIFPMSCEIISGNELAKFYVMDNEQRDCELRTRDENLDYEQRQRYTLMVRLNTIGSGSPKTLAQVHVNLLDKNDNRPVFQQPARYSHLTQNRFLAAIAGDAPSETQVIQVRASDADSPHSNGLISYELLNENELEGRFKVDPIDGIVRTSRPVEDLAGSPQLPLKLKVMARDNPEQPSNSLDSVAELIVNIIDDRHRIALALKDSPTGRVLDSKEELLSALQERSGLISGLEKAESLKIQRNGSLEPDVSGTDFWFYLIEPGTLRIVPNDDARVKSALFESRSQSSLLDVIGQIGFQKARVRLPYAVSGSLNGRSSATESSSRSSAFQSAGNNLAFGLILIALFIAVTSCIVIVYQCGFWSSYSRASKEKLYLQQQQQQQQQQSYYQCNSFLGACPKSQTSLTGSPHDPGNYPFRSAFSTLIPQPPPPSSLLAGCQIRANKSLQQQSLEPIYQLEPQSQQTNPLSSAAAATNNNNKEYETQMLKMSVIFDDCNSINEQNTHENNISKNLNI